MARLPQPGGDSGNWGDILNDYLAQSHKADGSIKDNSVGSSQLQDDSVTAAALAPNSVTGAALASDSVTATTIADGSIAEPLLAPAVQTKLNAPATIADGSVTNTKIAADSVSKNQLQQTLRDEIDAKLTKAVADDTYVPYLNLAKNPELIITGAITRDSNEALTSAAVIWPDGTPGTFTAETLSTAHPGAVDGYRITYGSPATRTYTQPTMTRNAAGAVTSVPAMVVS